MSREQVAAFVTPYFVPSTPAQAIFGVFVVIPVVTAALLKLWLF